MVVLAMAEGSGNGPNSGNAFVKTGRIDRATATSPLGPFACVQEDIIPHSSSATAGGFVGHPQVALAARRSGSGSGNDSTQLLLAVIGAPCAVYAAPGAEAPWSCGSGTGRALGVPHVDADYFHQVRSRDRYLLPTTFTYS